VYCILAMIEVMSLLNVVVGVVVKETRHQVFVEEELAKVLEWTIDVLEDRNAQLDMRVTLIQ
jgi:hypothetical protein